MKTANSLTSACRYCRYYQPEGRRGGMCDQLGVPVQSNWTACALATPPFTSSWKSLEEILLLENSLSLKNTEDCPSIEASASETAVKVKQPAPV